MATVNNEKVSTPVTTLCGRFPDVVRLSTRQSDSQAIDESMARPPKLGSLIWDGTRLAGEIDPLMQERYRKYTETRLNQRSFNEWLVNEG